MRVGANNEWPIFRSTFQVAMGRPHAFHSSLIPRPHTASYRFIENRRMSGQGQIRGLLHALINPASNDSYVRDQAILSNLFREPG